MPFIVLALPSFPLLIKNETCHILFAHLLYLPSAHENVTSFPLSIFTTYLRIAHNDMPDTVDAAEVTESKAFK